MKRFCAILLTVLMTVACFASLLTATVGADGEPAEVKQFRIHFDYYHDSLVTGQEAMDCAMIAQDLVTDENGKFKFGGWCATPNGIDHYEYSINGGAFVAFAEGQYAMSRTDLTGASIEYAGGHDSAGFADLKFDLTSCENGSTADVIMRAIDKKGGVLILAEFFIKVKGTFAKPLYDFTQAGTVVVGDSAKCFFGSSDKLAVEQLPSGAKLICNDDAHDPYITVEGLKLPATYRYAKIAYRTQATAEHLTVWLNPADGAKAQVALTADGKWHEEIVELADMQATTNSIRIEFLDGAADKVNRGDAIELAYFAMFTTRADADAYTARLDAHYYEVRDGLADKVITLGQYDQNAKAIGTGKTGVRFDTKGEQLLAVSTAGLATYGDMETEGTVTVWKWNGNYADTTGAQPVAQVTLKNHSDGQPVELRFDSALEAGEYYAEFEATSGHWALWKATDTDKTGIFKEVYYKGAVADYGAAFEVVLGVPGQVVVDLGDPFNPVTPPEPETDTDAATATDPVTDGETAPVEPVTGETDTAETDAASDGDVTDPASDTQPDTQKPAGCQSLVSGSVLVLLMAVACCVASKKSRS